jgi:hypothetical protein
MAHTLHHAFKTSQNLQFYMDYNHLRWSSSLLMYAPHYLLNPGATPLFLNTSLHFIPLCLLAFFTEMPIASNIIGVS